MEAMANCLCGEPDCWSDGDTTWLDERSSWRGTSHGCHASIYWVHGKKIAEERHIPAFSLPIADVALRLGEWCAGLQNPVLIWTHDAGGGDASLWIRDVRDPVASDWQRLREARARQLIEDRRHVAFLLKRIEANASTETSHA